MKGKEPLHFISVMLHRATIIQDDAFLDILAGYGYLSARTVLWYLGIIFLFALAYHHFGGLSLSPPRCIRLQSHLISWGRLFPRPH